MSWIYRDIETGEILTEEQLRPEYEAAMRERPEEPITFTEWLWNCRTVCNGTLEVIGRE